MHVLGSPCGTRLRLWEQKHKKIQPVVILPPQLFHSGHLCSSLTGLISALDEDCVQKGIEFVPARLMQKRPKGAREEVSRGRASKQGNGVWAPSSSEEDGGDSEDSMSDLYPCQSSLGLILVDYQFNALILECCTPTAHLFTLKKPTEETTGGDGKEEEVDDFQTDEDEDMDMEVDTPALQKRKKVRVRWIGVDFESGWICWTP